MIVATMIGTGLASALANAVHHRADVTKEVFWQRTSNFLLGMCLGSVIVLVYVQYFTQ